jgi:hypothetical protein
MSNVSWHDRRSLERLMSGLVVPTEVVLDIGCGIRPQPYFQPRLSIFCEPHDEYVRVLQSRYPGASAVILQARAQDVLPLLPDQSVDSVFLLDFIEHVEKDDGLAILDHCMRLARRQIVLFTPLGFMAQDYQDNDIDGWGLHGARWQVHRSGWTQDDFDDTWQIYACRTFHTINGKGEPFNPPFGAFYGVRNVPQPASESPAKAVAQAP